MGLNFRKSIKIIPGIRVNVSKKGITSVSVGSRGAKVNLGKKGVRTTVSAPGTGLSYSKFKPYEADQTLSQKSQSNIWVYFLMGIVCLMMLIWIFG